MSKNKNFCKESKSLLKEKLLYFLGEQFKLRIKKNIGKLNNVHLLNNMRINIARIKTLIREK
ncbi:50S ribosomal protein L29 [Candidatus Johnevansia muelleri]|uniref:Large ribosomal subunit protein uL29 n=1 Tax=Candidatus Johnevansia muelleri TaxID=1495769 RepID=A0A078KHG3_9GAMM|nr:50S ribosomal protein L29 [Candidatus Evansia muelleri]